MNNTGNKLKIITSFPKRVNTYLKNSNEIFQIPEFRKIMNEESFDLVIFGYYFNNFLLGLGDHFKCPTIVFITAGGINMATSLVGNPIDVAVVPHIVAPYRESMNFPQRLKTIAFYFVDYVNSLYTNYVNDQTSRQTNTNHSIK
jgi:hypothetical protein